MRPVAWAGGGAAHAGWWDARRSADRLPAAPAPRRALFPLSRAALAAPERRDMEAALAPLGRLLLEAAATYYALHASRVRQRLVDAAAALGACPPETAVSAAFKVRSARVGAGPAPAGRQWRARPWQL